MKIKTSELIGPALDWAVAKCDQPLWSDKAARLWIQYDEYQYSPSTNWAHGGPIIERERLNLSPTSTDIWDCWPDFGMSNELWQRGPTPLVAAMRCFVASKLGDEVEVPEELL